MISAITRCSRGLLVIAAGLLWSIAPAATAGPNPPLEDVVRAQGQLVEAMKAELESLRQAQRESADEIRSLRDQLAASPAGGSAITADYIDRRIEQYQTADDSRVFLSGYGSVAYKDAEGTDPSTFEASFNPIFHYQMFDDLHFNAELEFEIDDGGETQLELEFATIDYLLNDWVTISAGKFLTPFNTFGVRTHPAWINKMASRPVMYDKPGRLIGVLSDVGVMVSGGATLWDENSKVNYAIYAGNGPTSVGDEIAKLAFDNTPDENNNKTLGGRVGFLPIPNFEVGVSGMTGRTKGANGRFDLMGVDAWYGWDGLELRGEWARLTRGDHLDRSGYYVQVAYRLSHLLTGSDLSTTLGKFEPVLRYGQVLGDGPDDRERFSVGLNYWLYDSVPLKFTYEFNSGSVADDRLLVQLAYGF